MFVDISQSCKYYYVRCLSMVCIVRWKYQFLSRAGLAWLFWKCDLREISGQTDPHWLSDYAEVAMGDQEAGINFTVFVYFLSNWQQVCPALVSSPEISLLPLNSWCWSPCSTCNVYPLLSLVQLLHCCALIGRELQIVEIFSCTERSYYRRP